MSKKSLFERQRGALFKPKYVRQNGKATSYLDSYQVTNNQKLIDYLN